MSESTKQCAECAATEEVSKMIHEPAYGWFCIAKGCWAKYEDSLAY